MGDLDHDSGTMGMHGVSERSEMGDDLVAPELDIAEGLRAILRDDRGTANHCERDATLGLLLVIEAITLLRHAVFGIGGFMRSRHEAIAKHEMFQAIGLKEGISGGHFG